MLPSRRLPLDGADAGALQQKHDLLPPHLSRCDMRMGLLGPMPGKPVAYERAHMVSRTGKAEAGSLYHINDRLAPPAWAMPKRPHTHQCAVALLSMFLLLPSAAYHSHASWLLPITFNISALRSPGEA